MPSFTLLLRLGQFTTQLQGNQAYVPSWPSVQYLCSSISRGIPLYVVVSCDTEFTARCAQRLKQSGVKSRHNRAHQPCYHG